VEVAPPFAGQDLGLGAEDLTEVLIATKWVGQSIFDSGRRETPVYVARLLSRNRLSSGRVEPEDIQVLLWGEVRADHEWPSPWSFKRLKPFERFKE
jgi:hypothetical protein